MGIYSDEPNSSENRKFMTEGGGAESALNALLYAGPKFLIFSIQNIRTVFNIQITVAVSFLL